MSTRYRVEVTLPENATDSNYDDISQFIESVLNWWGLEIDWSEENETTRTFLVVDPQEQPRDMRGSFRMVADRFDLACTITFE